MGCGVGVVILIVTVTVTGLPETALPVSGSMLLIITLAVKVEPLVTPLASTITFIAMLAPLARFVPEVAERETKLGAPEANAAVQFNGSPPARTRGGPGDRERSVKLFAEVQKIYREFSPAAAKEMCRLALEAEDERVRRVCAGMVMDRAWGAPVNMIRTLKLRRSSRRLIRRSTEPRNCGRWRRSCL